MTRFRPTPIETPMPGAELVDLDAFRNETVRARLIVILVNLRIQQGLTQAEVARRMGINQPTVSAFERQGQEGRDCAISTVQRYARAIDAELYMWVMPGFPGMAEPPAGKTEGSGEEGTR